MQADNSFQRWLSSFLDEMLPVWINSPVDFCRDVLLFEPDNWQMEALEHIRDNPRVAVKSGQGVGKTGVEACTLIWFLLCFPYARIVATAPTKQQLNDVLWSEVAKWMNNSPLLSMLLKWTKTYIYMIGYEKRWFAVARTATKPENMQGFHEDNMLFIVDEASGVADPIMEAIRGTLSGDNNKLLMMGNPTKVTGAFHDAFTIDRAQWVCMTVSSRESSRTNKDNITSLDRKYGRNSNVVRVRVDGEFPEQDDDVFINISWLEQSINTQINDDTLKALGEYVDDQGNRIHRPEKIWRVDIGCDVARFGDDKTVIGYRINEVVRIYKKYNGQDTTWTSGAVAELFKEIRGKYQYRGPVPVKVDDGGVGGGVVDQLRSFLRTDPALFSGMHIFPVNFGQPIKHKHYADTTTFMMAVVRDLIAPFDADGNNRDIPEVVLPNDDDLVGQLSCRKYGFTSNGKQKVESKKEMKDRGLTSPDEADCLLLVCLPVKIKNGGNKSNGK